MGEQWGLSTAHRAAQIPHWEPPRGAHSSFQGEIPLRFIEARNASLASGKPFRRDGWSFQGKYLRISPSGSFLVRTRGTNMVPWKGSEEDQSMCDWSLCEPHHERGHQ